MSFIFVNFDQISKQQKIEMFSIENVVHKTFSSHVEYSGALEISTKKKFGQFLSFFAFFQILKEK